LQGARWDINTGSIADSRLKELHPNMPVMFIKALTQVAFSRKNTCNKSDNERPHVVFLE
jgi:dynein heavy chain